jgi:hypothetical protein
LTGGRAVEPEPLFFWDLRRDRATFAVPSAMYHGPRWAGGNLA